MTERNLELVVLSDDWFGMPSSCKHLVAQLGDGIDVTWVDTIGLREPSLEMYDLVRSVRKVAGWIKGWPNRGTPTSPLPLAVKTLDPVQLPFLRSEAIRRLNARNIARAIGRRQQGKKRVVLTTWPFLVDVLETTDADLKVYYRVDHFHKFPGVNERLILELEARQLQAVDLVVGSSLELLELDIDASKKRYLPHGVDYDHFASAALPWKPVADRDEKITVGFFGILDEWIDYDLIAGMAALRPNWKFCIYGPARDDISSLNSVSNIELPGPVPYADLPARAACFDVGIVPFKIDELTLAVNPLKLMEYSALGIPVVSTPLPEVIRHGELVAIADTPEQSVVAVEEILASWSEEKRAAAMKLAAAASWRSRAQQLKGFLNETGRVAL